MVVMRINTKEVALPFAVGVFLLILKLILIMLLIGLTAIFVAAGICDCQNPRFKNRGAG